MTIRISEYNIQNEITHLKKKIDKYQKDINKKNSQPVENKANRFGEIPRIKPNELQTILSREELYVLKEIFGQSARCERVTAFDQHIDMRLIKGANIDINL
ncbi:MAG: hypothetical protein K8S56_09360 [Candidatus Cloacimonetes bacterium]|nr:hypothetical protein [Candidatus Cloacimonadota bacterium]